MSELQLTSIEPGVLDDADVDATGVPRVEEWVRTLSKTVRAHQLYEGSNPVYDRFVDSLRELLRSIWQELPLLTLDIQETRILSQGQEVYRAASRSDNLAFLFYRDGVRQLTLLPGFEAEELSRFLGLLARLHRVRDEEDDLVTLLWQQELTFLRYRHVDLAADGLQLPAASGERSQPLNPSELRAELEADVAAAGSVAAATASEASELGQAPVSLQDPLHFLDGAELRLLEAELRRELERDLWRDLLHGLFDRLEDGAAERQERIVQIMADLLPGLISGGRASAAALILAELAALATRGPALPEPVLRAIRELFRQLADPRTVQELVRTIEDAPEALALEEFSGLLGYFPPSALEPLISAAESTPREEVRQALIAVVDRLASRDPKQVIRLLESESAATAAGAARLLSRMGVAEGAPGIAALLARPERSIRLAAISALQDLRVSTAAGALQNVLDDPDRDVRIAALRALAALRYTPARERLEELIASKRVREADVTERIAYFEAFGSVGGVAAVPVLERILNARTWLGRRETPEVRACAALALGRVEHADARAALTAAMNDPEPVVRTAVARALRSLGGK